jgi:hypothetical protein
MLVSDIGSAKSPFGKAALMLRQAQHKGLTLILSTAETVPVR